jgi:transcriptional regulator with XRE-family HTH domain
MGWSKHLKTQTALARKSHVAQSTIGRIVRGEVDPQSGNLQRLARALGMPLTELTRMAEDAEMEAGRAVVSERVPLISTEEIDRALRQALDRREDRKRAEQTLETLRRKENDAIKRLQTLVRAQPKRGGAMKPLT